MTEAATKEAEMRTTTRTKLILAPARFYDDHTERLGDDGLADTGRFYSKTRVQIDATPEGLRALLDDAKFYADPACMSAKDGCPQSVISSARSTVKTIEKFIAANGRWMAP
jgi:hypothetical protein